MQSVKNAWSGLQHVKKLAVYALGGNALQTPDGANNGSSQIMARVMSDIIDLLEMDWSVVITHGNGPQVGYLLSLDKEMAHGLDSWVGATQGMIGHELSLNLQAILQRRRRPERTAVMVTRVRVDSDDVAFSQPTKPVGPVLSAELVMSADWDIAQTIHGPRRVVASPAPLEILELEVIKRLVELQAVVVCGGGGGIPVIHNGEHFVGVPAVIDKDLMSSRLALDLDAHALIITTAADAIYTDFGEEHATAHRFLSHEQLQTMKEDGQFPPGSMAPKVKALLEFSRQSDECKSILCAPGSVLDALRGEAGTTIIP